jgi:hypothetical protein
MEHQVYPQQPSRDPSIDVININAMTSEHLERVPLCHHPRVFPQLKVPPPLTFMQKCQAFMGNDTLLALHAQRQASKHRYKRLY